MIDPDTRESIEDIADELQKLRLLLENIIANDSVDNSEIMDGYKQDLKSLNLEGKE